MAQALRVTHRLLDELQKDPQAYFRMAHEEALLRAEQQLEAEQQLRAEQEQRERRNYLAHNQSIHVG